MKKIIRKNPDTVSKPVGEYSHVTIVPKNSTLYTFSGQIGTDRDGNIPTSHNEQIKHTFNNIHSLLASEQLTSENIIKVNIWSTEDIDWDYFDKIWLDFFDTNPSMTIAYVQALGLPEITIEIEILAANV